MSRKSGSPRQQSEYQCKICNEEFKKYKQLFILHLKEKHGVEL